MNLQTEIQTIFTHLGRSPFEAATYLAALELGSGSAAQIAQKTGEGRTKIYFYIKKLVADGILKESRNKQRVTYVALPPRELASRVSSWATDLRGLVPRLESAQKAAAQTPIIEVTESKTGYYRIYDAITSMPIGSSFRVIEGRRAMEEELRLLDHDMLYAMFSRMIARDITTIGIFTKEAREVITSTITNDNLAKLSQRKWDLVEYPEATFNMQQLMFIYQNTVAFIFPETALVMTITHQGIADILASTFDAIHTFGTKVTPS